MDNNISLKKFCLPPSESSLNNSLYHISSLQFERVMKRRETMQRLVNPQQAKSQGVEEKVFAVLEISKNLFVCHHYYPLELSIIICIFDLIQRPYDVMPKNPQSTTKSPKSCKKLGFGLFDNLRKNLKSFLMTFKELKKIHLTISLASFSFFFLHREY